MLTAAHYLTGILIVLGVAACTATPSNDRNWQEIHSRLTTVAWMSETKFTLSDVRNWETDETGPTTKEWEDRRHDVRDVRAIWYFAEPFRYAPCFAHTFLTFEFGGGTKRDFLSLSVEARREVGEIYNPLAGLFGAYELMFVWSTEKDILTDTVIHLEHDLLMYRINVTPEQAQTILRGFLNRNNQIAGQPEFYDTLDSNCTSELADVVNREFAKVIPPDPSFVMTGNAPEYLHGLGYLGDPAVPFETLKAKADIGGLVREHRDLAERAFSIAIRRGLAAR